MDQFKESSPRFHTSMYRAIVLDKEFLTLIRNVCTSISDAGYDPFSQLTGYLSTGDDSYITRRENARSIVNSLEKDKIQIYINHYL